MISNAPISSPVSHSVSRTSRSGHICALFRIRVIAADGMSSPVKGSAIRLVRRKYLGNVPKYIHANGAVVIWHAIDMVAVFQIHLVGCVTIYDANRSEPGLPLGVSGHNPFIHGYMNAMPTIAAYESWNPASLMAAGVMQSWMTSAVRSTLPVLLYLPQSRAVSFKMMKRNALTSEGPAPVARVYVPQMMIVRTDLIRMARGSEPVIDNRRDIIM